MNEMRDEEWNYWKKRYDNFVSYLKNRFGSSWTLDVLEGFNEEEKQRDEK